MTCLGILIVCSRDTRVRCVVRVKMDTDVRGHWNVQSVVNVS